MVAVNGVRQGKLGLKLRVFTLEDCYRIERRSIELCGDTNWLKHIFDGNVELALDVLSGQLENSAVLGTMLRPGEDVRECLGRIVLAAPRSHEAIAYALADLFARGQPEARHRKTLARRIGQALIVSWVAFCTGAGGYLAWLLWTRFYG